MTGNKGIMNYEFGIMNISSLPLLYCIFNFVRAPLPTPFLNDNMLF